MNHLRTEQLTFSYSDQLVLDSISLSLRSGEVFVLLGANGSGKTTLLRMLARQLRPDGGQILVDDLEISGLPRRTMARTIAYMPQEEDRSTPLRVIDVVRLGRTPHVGWWLPMTSEDDAVVSQSLEAVGLDKLHEHPITQLSGGQWRRMILARALAQAAPILLLDEPTAGLDLKYQFEVLSRVRNMAKLRSLLVVLTLHDLNHAAMFGDRLALLSDHKILASGTAREVLRPELIEQAFGVAVSVIDHPVHGTPFVVPLYRQQAMAPDELRPIAGLPEAKP